MSSLHCRPWPIRLVASLALAVGCADGAAGQSYVLYGSPCGGSFPPALSNTDLPIVGDTFLIHLNSARPQSIAFLLFGFQQINLPLPPCTLLCTPDIIVALPTDAAGSATLPIGLPFLPELLGFSFYNQWLVPDPSLPGVGVATSNGGCATIGSEPPITLGTIPAVIPPAGGQVVFTGTNLGNDPDNLCIRVVDMGSNDTMLLRAVSIQQGVGLQTVTAEVKTDIDVNACPSFVGVFQVMRGDGSQPGVGQSGVLGVPSENWAWDGMDLPGNGAAAATTITPAQPATQYEVKAQLVANAVVLDFPDMPFDSSTYLSGYSLLTDIHVNSQCPGQVLRHYDFFMQAVGVLPASATCAQVVTDHAAQIQQICDSEYGSGVFQVTAVTDSGQCRIRMQLADASCVLSGLGGKTIIAP